jgi:hypothetical protein
MRIVLLIAVLMTGTAHSQTSAPAKSSQPIVVQQQTPLAIQYDHGTEDKPFVITNRPSQEDKKADRDKAIDDHELTVATKDLAQWTLVLGLASIAAAFAAVWSSWQSSKAAKDLHKLERAYLFARVKRMGIDPEKPNKLRTFNLKVYFHNHGKTPAVLKVLRQTMDWTDAVPTQLPENPKANKEMPQGLVVGAGKTWAWPVHVEITNQQWGMLQGHGDNRAYVYGLMKYEDVMGNEHEVGFCWHSENQKRNGLVFLISPTKLNYFT